MNEVLAKDVELEKNQKEIAVGYLQKLGIFKPYIDGFVKEDKVCFFENFGGYWVYQEEEVEKKMREIEAEYNCKVYAITHNRVNGDDMWSFLIVTAHREEWDDLLAKEGSGFYAFSYTWNKTYDDCSEFGDVYIQSFGGGIRRLA